jgi:hypothetical protein
MLAAVRPQRNAARRQPRSRLCKSECGWVSCEGELM